MKMTHLLGVSTLAMAASHMALASSAAQDTDDKDNKDEAIEEIIVSGIRGSLQSASSIKRNESGVVDAITSEQIGKFPDSNLAESLQRITGVSIDRQNNEGNQVSVRGLGPSFNLVTLNGRQMPVSSSPEQETINSATQSRAFNFAEIASESVAGVNVYKTVRADLPTGGIGAAVDIRTARPLDIDGIKLVASVAGTHDLSVGPNGDDITPELGALFSGNFFDGKLGLLVNGSYSERSFEDREEHTDGWIRITPEGSANEFASLSNGADLTGVSQLYRPITNISEVSDNKRIRGNAQFVVQFEPVQGLRATFDYTLSRFERDEIRFQTGVFGDPANHGVQSLTFDSNGTFTNYAFSGAADFLSYENELRVENDSLGANIDWEVSDTFTVNVDYHSSDSQSQPDGQLNDLLTLNQGALGVNFGFAYSEGPTQITVDDSGANRGNGPFGGGDPIPGITGFLDPDSLSPLGTFVRNISIRNEVEQIQLKSLWEPDDMGALKSVAFGGSYIEYGVQTSGISSGFTFQGLGADPTFPNGETIPLPCDICNEASGVFVTGNGSGIPGGFDTILRTASPLQLAQTFPIQLDDIVPNVSNSEIVEESYAAYFSANFETEIQGMVAKANVGLRYEKTDVTGTSFQSLPIALQTTSLTEQVVLNSPDVEAFSLAGSYDHFLPAVDLQVQPNDEMVVRLSYGRSLARPDLNALRPSLLIAETDPFGPFNAFQGNPDLRPFLSDNIDVSYEWYYDEASYVAVSYFYKNVSNFIGTNTVQGTVPNVDGNPLTDPSPRFIPADATTSGSGPVTGTSTDPVAQFSITAPFNEDEGATINGLEIAAQHIFPSGFGIQANYTFVDSDAEFDPAAIVQAVNLLGLSDSANLVLFYEKGPFQIRVAGNYRGEFLFSTNQLRVPGEPVFFDDYIQIDASASYDFTDNLTAFVQVLNATGEDQRQFGRFKNQFLFQNDQEPRITVGIRANF